MGKGDFLLVDYTVRVKDTGELLDTTKEDVAKEEGFERDHFGPELIIVGQGWVLKSVDEELEKMGEGESKVIEIPPERAYGKRDPGKIKILSAKELKGKDVHLRVGETVRWRNMRGKILRVGAGRVIVDFNNPLAGKTLIYEVSVVKVLKDVEEKLRALLSRRVVGLPEDVKVRYSPKTKTATVELPLSLLNVDMFQYALKGFIDDVERYMKDVGALRVLFKVKFEREEAKEAEAPAEPKPE